MFRKVGAPEFRKKGEREKKEKIDESKKKMEYVCWYRYL
jgi:hypothetical protein